MLVFLNPGHDLWCDPGAVNPRLDLTEAALARELGLLVWQRLLGHGIGVMYGQDDDLFGVICTANRSQADLFVSLHFNAFNGRATGTETLVSGSAASLQLGRLIQANVTAVLGLPDRHLKERRELLVLNSTAMPAVLVETCFIDNDGDIRRYLSSKQETADAIATGIIQYQQSFMAKAA